MELYYHLVQMYIFNKSFFLLIKEGEFIGVLGTHTSEVSSLLNLDIRLLISTSYDGNIMQWDTMSGNCEAVIKMPGRITKAQIWNNKNLLVLIEN